MKKTLLALAFLAALPAAVAYDGAALFSDIGSITEELSEISGLKILKPVPHDTLTREGLKVYIQKKIKDEVKPEEIRTEELALKKFGFVPPDFDLEKATVDLLTEQAAAFYDYRKKRLYIIGEDAGPMQQMALVHELSHALADQHFNLDKYIRKSETTDDQAMARLAVMEGQASWLTFEYLSRKMGKSLKDDPEYLQTMVSMMKASSGQFPVLDNTPPYLRETLLFPYTAGTMFQHRVYEKLGKESFAEVFRKPPVSTQQILHPEKYFEKVAPPPLKPPAVPSPKGLRKVIDGSFGELDHAILLRQYAGKDAEALAASWRASAFEILESKRRETAVLAYASEWEDEAAARKFFEAYRKVLQGKWKRFKPETESASELAGSGDDGRFVVRLEGKRVTSVEGLPSKLN
jgi:hypothetical protein